MMKGGDTVHSQAKDDPEVKRVTRPGRYSMRSKLLAALRLRAGLAARSVVMRHMVVGMYAQEGDASSVDV